jgi:hypothetical protein
MSVKCSKDDVAMAIWERRCTPIVGNKLILDGLFKQRQLGPMWVDHEKDNRRDPVEYPLQDCANLVDIAQYFGVKMGTSVNAKRRYLQFLKSGYIGVHQTEYDDGRTFVPPATLRTLPGNTTFTELVADHAHHPAFVRAERSQAHPAGELQAEHGVSSSAVLDNSWRDDPLTILAGFPIDVFVTTSHHLLLERALSRVGKFPVTDVYQWMEAETIRMPSQYGPVRVDLEDPQRPHPVEWADFEPRDQTPLVCHLFGVDSFSKSLVLTEDDHIDFMLKANQLSMQAGDQVPPAGGGYGGRQAPTDWLQGHVRTALAERLLLLVGYEIDGWDLRALLKGLIVRVRRRAVGTQEISVAVQMAPCNSGRVRDEGLYQDYLEEYFGGLCSFKIFWEPADDFMVELDKRVNG